MRRLREVYGAGPLHLPAVLATFGVAAYAISRAFDELSDPVRFVLWYGGAIPAHDLVLIPLYSLLGLIASTALLGPSRGRVRLAALNHLRVPALLSGLLLLVWFPLVFGVADAGFRRTTGLSTSVYLERWLLLSAALFAGSALVFALRVRRLVRHS